MSRFFFAWVDPEETEFLPEHEREDEFIVSLQVVHEEGNFAGLSIVVRNPHVGLLNVSRKQWAWLAFQGDDTGDPEPLFFGRLVGLPDEMADDLVSLSFIARPIAYDTLRRALAATLKVRPYYDPIWITPDLRDEPDAVLEARPALWHIDRVTHAVTISDVNSGEDGVIDIAGDYIADSLRARFSQVPGRRVKVHAQVGWDQTGFGTVDLTAALLKAAKDAGSGNGQNIDTYTGDGLATDWPEQGDSIGGGWSFGDSYVIRGNGKWVPVETERVVLNDGRVGKFPSWSFRPVLNVVYDIARSRTETLTFTLEADVQAILTEPGEDEIIALSFSSAELNEPIDDDETTDATDGFVPPIQDARRNSYFKTDRGRQSLEYLIATARAKMLARARCVEISFTTTWERGLALSCRKNVRIADDRLPGGEATGKVIAYALTADGNTGQLTCEVTIGCTIGQGNTVSAAAGTPDYVEDGYVEDGYQTRTGQLIMPIAGEVTYEDFSTQAIDDDGVDFFNMTPDRVVDGIEIIDGKVEQLAILRAFHNDFNEAVKALNAIFTEIQLDLVPLNTGPFETSFAIEVSDLMIPKTIDLEAGA